MDGRSLGCTGDPVEELVPRPLVDVLARLQRRRRVNVRGTVNLLALLEREARPLTEEEILAAYDRAEEAYGWFYLATLPCGSEGRTVDG